MSNMHVCTPECEEPDGLHVANDRLAIEDEVRLIHEKLDNMIELVGVIKDQVEPTIKALGESPVFKMLGVKV